ncbi:SDR family NAD(P)-dependent oxidoreductase [Sodalis-like endosymbiont of Proechinophthirus fluctus]|uniref:SDR family NAD(P)-dependent oxidoreductase n=1 Tax=Sodalis-like endosymbiont of Proechinophthirus fluctus TaxID=1462730 RepID=UPI000836F406|nr:SDR family NAD(P)-dependent oxidoreductase [Sodalis-like endosymbiont of Proechinophthirus fluctus]
MCDQVAALKQDAPDHALALDVTDEVAIASAVKAAINKFGSIDVLVSNTGYGYHSVIEEDVEEEIRARFDTNVFSLFVLTRAVMPLVRAAPMVCY